MVGATNTLCQWLQRQRQQQIYFFCSNKNKYFFPVFFHFIVSSYVVRDLFNMRFLSQNPSIARHG